jgi:hypothetical protein
MSDEEELPDDLPGFLARRPSLQYVLLAGLGILGVYLSAPLDFAPLSTVEWVDLMINIAILVPSCVLLGAGTVLAVVSGLSPRTLSEESRPARFTRMVLRTVGIPRAIVPEVAALGPIGLLLQIFWGESRKAALPDGSDADEHADP